MRNNEKYYEFNGSGSENSQSRSTEKNNTIIIWWPNAVFSDIHWRHDPGQIPLELKKLGYKVTLVVGFFRSKMKHEEVDVVETYVERKEGSVPNLHDCLVSTKSMVRLVRQYHPKSIIIIQYPLEALIFIALLRLKIVTRSRPSLIVLFDVVPEEVKVSNKRLVDVFYRFLFSILSDKITTYTECNLAELTRPKLISNYKNKYSVISPGFTPEKGGNEDKTSMRRYNRILSVGRITYQKGHDLLISIFSKIVSKFPDWELRIVGMLDDKPYFESLERKVADLNLQGSVKLLTDLSDEQLDREYEEASIFCLLSRYESFGISRAEAIYHELPMVISETGCGIYYKRFGSFVCKIDDQDCITNALESLILDEGLRKEIAKRQKGAARTWHDVAVDFSNLIERL